jgi:prepilin-type processing-associated H-X9-DG protein
MEQDNIYKVFYNPIAGVNQTDGYNNFTSTDPSIVAALQAPVSIFLCPSRRGPPSVSPITTGSTVMGIASDYAASTGDTSAVPTTGVFQMVNANHMTALTRMLDITDGRSNTIMIGEKHIERGFLNDPIQDGLIYSGSEQQTYMRRGGGSWPLAISPDVTPNTQFGSWHAGVCQFVFADGSVHALHNSTPGSILALFTNRCDNLPTPSID